MKVFVLLLVMYDPVQLALDRVNQLVYKLDNSQEVNLRYELLQIHQWLYMAKKYEQSKWPEEEPAPSTQTNPGYSYPPPLPKEECDESPFPH